MPRQEQDGEVEDDFDLSDAQGSVEDALKAALAIVAALKCAESCETREDFLANVREARDAVDELKTGLSEIETGA